MVGDRTSLEPPHDGPAQRGTSLLNRFIRKTGENPTGIFSKIHSPLAPPERGVVCAPAQCNLSPSPPTPLPRGARGERRSIAFPIDIRCRLLVPFRQDHGYLPLHRPLHASQLLGDLPVRVVGQV